MEPSSGTSGVSQIANEILAYLTENLGAQDTLEGIMEWWLLEQNIKRGMAQVKEALAELVARGLVLEHKGRDSRTHYCINRGRYKEIRALVLERSWW